jgi:hypothetical protein
MPQTPQEKKSVQTFPDAVAGEGGTPDVFWLHLSTSRDEAPTYWSYARDAWLREFVYRPGNDLLVGAMSTVAAKVATTGFVLEGPERTANFYRNKLVNQIDFGAGWSSFIMKWVWDYLSQDTGGWAEQIGQKATVTSNRLGPRTGAAMGWSHLDNGQLRLTADPQWPATWVPYWADKKNPEQDAILMHRSRLMQIVDSPTPNVRRRFIGFCAVSRSLATAQILLDITQYERERLSDLPPAGLLLVNNLTQNQWEDLEKRYSVRQQQQDNRTWKDIMVAFGIRPEIPVTAELLSFSNLPEHFDKKTATEIAIYSFALAFRIDPREIWPVATGSMGTATEANIQHLKARAKGPGLIMTDIERIFNSGTTIAPSLTFQFDFQDAEEDLQSAAVANAKADFITKLTNSQILDADMARQWLVKEGLFDEQDLLAFGAEEQASDVEEAKSLLALDMGPRTRVFSDPNKSPIRLEKMAQLWNGFARKGGPGSGFFGHAGRPGEVGGSQPEGARAAPEEAGGIPQTWKPGTVPGEIDVTGARKSNDFLVDGLTMKFPGSDISEPLAEWDNAPLETRAQAKDEIVRALVEKTGLDYETVNAFVQRWSGTAANHDMRALDMQLRASEVFGVPLRPSVLDRMAEIQSLRESFVPMEGGIAGTPEGTPEWFTWEELGVPVEDQRTFLRGMYDLTQERLQGAGYQPGETIKLYRGTSFGTGAETGDILEIAGNPLQSWTSSRGIGEFFAAGRANGGVFAMDVPIETIVGTARSGFGALKEAEFVIMGADVGHTAMVEQILTTEFFDE